MKTFWDRVALFYDAVEHLNAKAVRGMAEYVAQQMPEGAAVLECAAGTGEISLACAKRAQSVLCTDLSLPMLLRAEKKAVRQGADNVRFAVRDLTALTDGDGCYDVVCAANVIHLLDAPEAALRELWRVTAPGGSVILPTFLLDEAGGGFRLLIKLYQAAGFRFKRHFDRGSYRAFLEAAGYPVQTCAVAPGRMPVGIAVLKKSSENPGRDSL